MGVPASRLYGDPKHVLTIMFVSGYGARETAWFTEPANLVRYKADRYHL
ncbi:hypothetical protein CCP3SC15_1450007 [Gammaproteobacteria bacterium]